MKTLGLITARGGSKGLPGKNIKDLCGKPLIAWTIEEALKSKMLSDVIVSTDSEEIAEISKKYGAKVPWIRPSELARDDTKHFDVVRHAVLSERDKYDLVCLLQPTSPLRIVEDIDNPIKRIHNTTTNAIISVVECYEINNVFWKAREKRRQEIKTPEVVVNGAVYVNRIKSIFNEGTLYPGCRESYIMPKERSYQIDDQIDFDICEMLIRKRLVSV